jgi:hypothetical protein
MSTEEVTTTTVTAVEEKDSSTDTFPEESVAAAAVSPSPEETESEATESEATESETAESETAESEATESSSSDEDETASTSESSESSTNSVPLEMVAWMDSIQKIEYHFRTDDYDEDRSFNFFKDTNGNTLKITEFYVGDIPYVNVNDDVVMRRDNFLSVSSVTNLGGASLLKFEDKSTSLMLNASTNLVAEALMILGDSDSENESDCESDCESDTCSESSCEDEEKIVPEPAPEPKRQVNDSRKSVVNFLYSFFFVMMLIKSAGMIITILNRN